MRSAVLTVGSLCLTAVVVANAFYQKRQFYPSVVYITKSSFSMVVIYLQALVMVVLAGEIMRKVFFGQLRTAELEHLIDRSWYVVTETCLAFTIFRDDFSPKFVALFTLLLFLKCFHWLADDRVDYMERSPVISALFHIRVVSLLISLGTLDAHFVYFAYQSIVTKGASVQLVFGFEYAILLTVVINVFIKYVLHTIDLQSENPWENKAVFLLYTELVIGFVKLVLYICFVAIMIKIHTFPLFVIRPMYHSMRMFKKAFSDVIMSRRAIRNMNTLYPDATPEELATLDNVCIICREEMVTASKKLPCNHIFHTSCLRSWFQRQQTCPTCRMDVLRLPTPQQQRQQNAADLIRAAAAAAAAQNFGQTPPAQPPQAAAQQPPPPLNIPGFFPNVLPGPYPLWPPMPQGFPGMANHHHHQQQQQQPQETGGDGTGTSTSPAANSPSGPIGSEANSRSASDRVPPPFSSPSSMYLPPFFLPPPIPPPVPPPNFGKLSDDELRAMEGDERSHVEARIRCLRDIQIFLDAAVMLMQQYSSVVATLNSGQQHQQQRGHSNSSTSTASAAEFTATSKAATSNSGASSAAEISEDRKASKEAESLNGDVAHDEKGAEETLDNEDDTLDERERLRRRRLQKFSESSSKNGSD